MANKVIKSVNLLPEFLKTDKNKKFLSSTIDQLIQPPQLERIDGFIGSKLTPNYVASTDFYISETLPLRKSYQLEPALTVKDSLGVVNDVIGLDDLTNEISTRGGIVNNLDRLYRTEFYSYNPHIDWDKLINYQAYYWLVNGPEAILITGPLDTVTNRYTVLNIENDILGKTTYTSVSGIKLSDGMKVRFGGSTFPESYLDNEYFVEGVGTAIKLVKYSLLSGATKIATLYTEHFDEHPFDEFPFDNSKTLPTTPDYITINRASQDLNPWSQNNRWVHADVIKVSALANGLQPTYPDDKRANRPIVEFKADLKLFNFGSLGLKNIDLIDTITKDAFSIIEGSAGYYVDGVLLEQGNRVVFNADTNNRVRGKIYQVNYITIDGNLKLELVDTGDIFTMSSVGVNLGKTFAGTNWWFNGDFWQYSQQRTSLNQAPLFDLFDDKGNSYSDKKQHLSNFTGNKIFGYEVGTGTNDTVLGFPLKYKNSIGLGSYLFKNYFTSDVISLSVNNQEIKISTAITYCKFADGTFANVWKTAADYQIPILQVISTTEETSRIELTAIDNPTTVDLLLEVFVDGYVVSNYTIDKISGKYLINFNKSLPASTNVLLKIRTKAVPNSNGYYEPPLGLTNNPFNGPITSLTLSELSDHLHTMINKTNGFVGEFPGSSNLRDLSDETKYGNRLISNINPMSFANFFIGKKEHSVIDAITKSGDQYNQFKILLLKKISEISDLSNPITDLDRVLTEINLDKDIKSPYYLSDMIAYGTDNKSRTWTVTNSRNIIYPLASEFDPKVLSTHSILIYLNGNQLLSGIDYEFEVADSTVKILKSLSVGDTLIINDYHSTLGCFVPPTPSKLGLYPKYQPRIYQDYTYSTPVNVIQGHDGSITVAYNDFRDAIILEFEKRIYNNIKAEYRSELFDVNSIFAGAFRNSEYSNDEINKILSIDFLKWAGFYGIDYTLNSSFEESNSRTWNYQGGFNTALGQPVNGSWRAIFKKFYDTDRPNTHPWEMLGIADKPTWWEKTYGVSPYTAGNKILWNDLEQGLDRNTGKINPLYARPGLNTILPVDDTGNLVNIESLVINWTIYGRYQSWKFGDYSPAETAWRRSSYWPFAVQKLLALTKPAKYASMMYDTSRISKNIAGQWTYGEDHIFLNPKKSVIYGDDNKLTSGYSVYISEIGRQRSSNYITELVQDLSYLDFNLFYKVGGFVSKDKLQVIIDAIDPTSTSPGALLPQEDYDLILNTSNPIKTSNISGIIVQRSNGKFVVKGYDKLHPYFTVYEPMRTVNTSVITVGGISESYVTWASSTTGGSTGLSSADTTTANVSANGKFYQAGQIVYKDNRFFRVKTSHQSGSTFNTSYFQPLADLPTVGGAIVQIANKFDTIEKQIPYGTEYTNIQDIYDLIIGYGKWLESQGFIFDEYNTDLSSPIDWNFTGKEFLYWTTQNWATNSIITLSPFASQLKYKLANSVVDNIFDSFYEYSILQANGVSMPQQNLNISRDDGVFTIQTPNSTDGIYFATIHSVQKEHAMVFNNTTRFNDTIYDIETGYRQYRMKLSGFRTANWNGDYFSPGFIYDTAQISDWQKYAEYQIGALVRFSGNYYSANQKIVSSSKFNFSEWDVLGSKPIAGLLPNFDYKINQFEDFYSLDIDNFDSAQQQMAQHLIGYTPRVYLNNIFTNPIAQYKFYQGFIKEKGTKNSISKLAKASIHNLQGEVTFTEEWAFRIGQYGSYETYQELEVPLIEGTFIENPQIISFVDVKPLPSPSDLTYYSTERIITPKDYISSSTFVTSDTEFLLNTAGYVRIDDVNFTAYNETDLLSIAASNSIAEGDAIWLGFKKDGSWDILRYVNISAKVVEVVVSEVGAELTFSTNDVHNLIPGEVISISQFNNIVNGVYTVVTIPTLDKFTVETTLSVVAENTPAIPAQLFKFESAKFNNFDSLPSDDSLLKSPIGTKFWVNDDGFGKWVVYEKTKNHSSIISKYSSPDQNGQKLGWSISHRYGSDIFVVGAPGNYENNNQGGISVYNNLDSRLKFKYTLNHNVFYQTTAPNTPNEFGYSVVYDDHLFSNSGYGLIFAGAPAAGNIRSTGSIGSVRNASSSEAPSSFVHEGLVKISSIDAEANDENSRTFVLLSPRPSSYERFGSSLFVQRNADTKLLLVGAPQTANTGTGTVYAFTVITTATSNPYYTSTTLPLVDVTTATTVIPDAAITLGRGSQWGYSIAGSDDSKNIAISAPGYSSNSGIVQIFSGTIFRQTIQSRYGKNSRFGECMAMSPSGDYLFISAPNTRNDNQSLGKVAVYKKINSLFTFISDITNPLSGPGMKFGSSLNISEYADTLAISSMGTNSKLPTTFDKTNLSIGSSSEFDYNSTIFYDGVKSSGTVYVYSRKFDRFLLVEELYPPQTIVGTNFGRSISVDSNVVYVGAPGPSIATTGNSGFHKFVSTTTSSLTTLRYQDNLVSVNTMQKVMLVDSFNEEIIDYLDIIDPLKGKIGGLADQELKYKTSFDPAVYTVGTSTTVIDSSTNWLDNHVGELWWDLSTVKYQWYEQGESTFRKNSWGRLFPGSKIDVYEWVSSEYLPSEWDTIADTSAGLTEGISGTPKFIDDSVYSIKQTYDATTGLFSNRYYYWVKNKIIIPDVKNRRISSYQVSSIIEDPNTYGLKYIAPISKNAVILSNIGAELVADRIHINISTDSIDNTIPKHTEWLLLQEGSAESRPNTLLEKKLIDSLIGHDSFGNLVPDPTLSSRTRYGIGIRPQQTLFKDRKAALRNLIEFTNSVLIENQITGNYDFTNLNKQDSIPDEYSHAYDQIVEDNEGLAIIDTRQLALPELSCTVQDGQIRSVSIDNVGFGYKVAPSVEIISSVESSAKITTEIDSSGRIISVNIADSGSGFPDDQPPMLKVRPFTVIVLADSVYNNKWTIFVYDTLRKEWLRANTQKYNTTMYWKYQDWSSADFNKFIDYAATVDEVYEIDTVPLSIGQYIKVRNGGDGRYIILEKLAVGSTGSFSDQFNIVYSEKGTIQILDTIWDFANNDYGFDYVNSYDQTLFDQTPDLELQYILSALKKDIFINELKINWNLFFFKAVKYALSEQKLLDWAFKTSFINVKNLAGTLDQRTIYKMQNSEYFENYVNEVKPYHTNIRTFTTDYTTLESTKTYTTDFDLPTYYNKSTGKFSNVESTNPLLDIYPWKSWKDNNSYSIGNISVGHGGSGYINIPRVDIIPAVGDTGTGATAVAHINSGVISSINIVNSGHGYKTSPTINLVGGGETTPAVAYAQLVGGTVRTNKIGMKFDRTNKRDQIGNLSVTDNFVCNGSDNKFVLNWLAEPDKFKIDVSLDGGSVLRSDYTIEYYTEMYNGYNKKFNRIFFLNFDPEAGQVLKVTYIKNIELLTATERILNYYTATSGMVGPDLAQLMDGIEYPDTVISTLPLDYTTAWDISYTPFGKSAWADNISYYTNTTISSTATAGTSTLVLTTTTGLTVGQQANITGSIVNKFSTTTDIVITSINTATRTVGFSSRLSGTVYPGYGIEFWNYDANNNSLDSAIDGGTWNTSTRINALGINPEDLTIDGDIFLSASSSYAPEELVPGYVTESIGINVYTKNPQGAPIVFANGFDVLAGTTTTNTLSMVPPSEGNIVVTFGGNLLEYTTTTNFTTSTQFSINWNTNEITIPPQSTNGRLGYTILGIGGGRPETEAGVVDCVIITDNTPFIQLQSLSDYGSIKSAYVTVNGKSISKVTTSTNYGYMLTYSNDDNNRAAVNVYNLPAGTNTVQAWFFANNYRYFNEVNQETIQVSNPTQRYYTLTKSPGTAEPMVGQAIVEVKDVNGRRTRLLPPFISYYDITGPAVTTFRIDNHKDHLADTFTISNVRVYINGILLRAGFDFSVNSIDSTVNIDPVALQTKSTIAVIGLPRNRDVPVGYDYDIIGNTLILSDPKDVNSIVPNRGFYNVITYTDHDGMLMRTERFDGNPSRRYKISRPVLDDNYVWVEFNGVPITSKTDYEILDDRVTIQVSDQYYHSPDDNIIIQSISSEKLASTILGYRIFNDIFNRTHFKRLSKQNTTYLTKPLKFTDTEIYVADATVLTPPLVKKKIPGVVIIDGERIEFFNVTGNVLSQLRRSTLGTAPSFYSQENTRVIDQSPEQNIPFRENIYKQIQFTKSDVNTYNISKTSKVLNTGTQHRINSDGITLSLGAISAQDDYFVSNTLTTSTAISAVDQVEVFYGGRPLRKSGILHQDITVSYDSPEAIINTNKLASADLLPITTVMGSAYIITATNHVWVYTNSTEVDSINGYVYRGLNYQPPEFTITINTSTQALTLNIAEGVSNNVKLVIVKKEFAKSDVWNTVEGENQTHTLMDSDTVPARFLQLKPAELPDKYYYGGNFELMDNSGQVLLDENGQPLEGI